MGLGEIRDLIYLALLTSEDPTPTSPSETLLDRKTTSEIDSPYLESCTRYPQALLPASTSSLLLTCRQIHDETLTAIANFKSKSGLLYILDCMIEDEQRIYPTWLLIPAVASDIDRVDVNFRLFGTRKGHSSAFISSDVGPSPLMWSLLSLLYRFLDCGPDFMCQSTIGRKVTIGTIVLNVNSPAEPAGGFIPVPNCFNAGVDGLMHPEGVVSILHAELNILLDNSSVARYADVVYEQVRRVVLALDGKTRAEWDLTTMSMERAVRFRLAR